MRAAATMGCLLFFTFVALGAVEAQRLLEAKAGVPLAFEANVGQADPQARFLARGYNYQFIISPSEAQLSLCRVEDSGGDSRLRAVRHAGACASIEPARRLGPAGGDGPV